MQDKHCGAIYTPELLKGPGGGSHDSPEVTFLLSFSCCLPYSPPSLRFLPEHSPMRHLHQNPHIRLSSRELNLRQDMRFLKIPDLSLVAQRVKCLPTMRETWVRSLIQENPTCPGATKPVHHIYWACPPQQGRSPQWEAQTWQLQSSPCSPQLKKSPHSNEDPAQPKINKYIKK